MSTRSSPPEYESMVASSGSSSTDELRWSDALGDALAEPTSAPASTATSDATTATPPPPASAIFPMRSYDKWCPAKQGSTLVWRDVCVYATRVAATAEAVTGQAPGGKKSGSSTTTNTNGGSGPQLKRIINNATGAIRPGTLMALMGSRCESLGLGCIGSDCGDINLYVFIFSAAVLARVR